MQMTPFNYIIKPRAHQKIRSFYRNVAKKYKHTYDFGDFARDVQNAVFSIYQIERSLLRREPILKRWEGCYMANTDKWYYAYKIEGNTIIIVDACHAQNMYDEN